MAGSSITQGSLPLRTLTTAGEPVPSRPAPPWRWTRAAGAGVAGLIFVVGGLVGLGWVGDYWSSAQQCPTAPPSFHVPGCVGPVPPLTTENATVIIVASVASLVFLSLGVLFVFIAAYFPVPQPGEPPTERRS